MSSYPQTPSEPFNGGAPAAYPPVPPVDDKPLLSQPARVVDTFVAPSKTFTDILRSAACWLPIVLVLIVGVAWVAAIDKKVGFDAVTEQQISKNARADEAMKSLPPPQRAARMEMQARITRGISYGFVVPYLIIMAIEALVLWGSFNVLLGAGTKFPQVFAVAVFASLPRQLLLPVLSAILLFAGVGTENFDMRNPVGTNLGYYLTDSPHWMQAGGAFFDVLGFWSLALLVLGMAIVSGKKIASSAAVVIGWWALILLVTVGFAAF